MRVPEGDAVPPRSPQQHPEQGGSPPPASPPGSSTPLDGAYPSYPAYPGPPLPPQGYAPGAGYPQYPQYPSYPQYPGYPGYPPPPGGMSSGWSPAPPPGQERQYGRVGVVPWTYAQAWRGALLTIIPWLLAMVLLQLAGGALNSSGTTRTPTTSSRGLDAAGAVIALILSIVVEGIFLIAPLVYALAIRPRGVMPRDGARALGFRSTGLLAGIGWVAGGFIFMIAVSLMYDALVTALHLPLKTNVQALSDQISRAPLTVLASLLGAVLIAPLCEETFFRGYLFAGLLRGMNVWAAVLVSAVLFTLVHGDIGSAVPLFVFGIVLAVIRWRSGSIWPGIALHAANNALAAAILLPAILKALGT